jgi:hypothetical protein
MVLKDLGDFRGTHGLNGTMRPEMNIRALRLSLRDRNTKRQQRPFLDPGCPSSG